VKLREITRGGSVSKKADENRKTIRKQKTGKPGRPKEVEVKGGANTEPVPVQRLSAISGTDAPKGVVTVSGGTPKVPGVEIVSRGGTQSTTR